MRPRLPAVASALLTATLLAVAAHGQNRDLRQRLAHAARIDCSFSVVATGNWEDGAPLAAVAPAKLETAFSDINVDEGTAEADSKFGSSFIIVKQSDDYLHFVQMFNAGPLYVTTVFARQTADGRFLAVHTRHEYLDVALPGFTSRPETYVGSCEVSD